MWLLAQRRPSAPCRIPVPLPAITTVLALGVIACGGASAALPTSGSRAAPHEPASPRPDAARPDAPGMAGLKPDPAPSPQPVAAPAVREAAGPAGTPDGAPKATVSAVDRPSSVPAAGAEPAPGTQPALSAKERARLAPAYLGRHRLGVNRIEDSLRLGRVTIVEDTDGAWQLEGGLRGRGRASAYYIALAGRVHPVSAREFILEGEIRGVPDMRWAGETPRERHTTGRFRFIASGRRRYWRMYEVDGRDCVCGDGCGNDFCYIDIEFARPRR